MYFPLGGGTLKGISKPGEIVCGRIFVEGNRLKADLGRATVVELPPEEVARRWQATTSQWPMMNAGAARRDARPDDGTSQSRSHSSAYGKDVVISDTALMAKAAAFRELGIEVYLCGCKVGE